MSLTLITKEKRAQDGCAGPPAVPSSRRSPAVHASDRGELEDERLAGVHAVVLATRGPLVLSSPDTSREQAPATDGQPERPFIGIVFNDVEERP